MTAAVFRDRVQETTTTTGTGTVTLAGAVSGYRTFAAAFGADRALVPYVIVDPATGDWETGFGTFTLSGTTLSRSVSQSSNANALVNFAAGPKNVLNAPIAADAVGLTIKNVFTKPQIGNPVTLTSSSNSVALDASLGNNFEHLLTENTTIANPSGLTDGQIVNLTIRQAASGGPYTVAFASGWKFPSTPVMSTGASVEDQVSSYRSSMSGDLIASYRNGA